ncbi:hypothetical protein CSZ94_15515 [Janthinobacterium sp. ROICE36]|nr:hypothetical protein CSZ94_15515 [Janthinobacterium sp. ROICE36]
MVDVIGDNVDCVIRGGELRDQSLMARKIGDLQLAVYAAPAYLQRVGTPGHPQELEDAQHRIVRFRWGQGGNGFSTLMRQGDKSVTIAGKYVLSIDDGNAYLAAGLAGLGALVPLFAAWRIAPMPLYLAYPPNRHVSKKLRVFIDWVVELMTQHAPLQPHTGISVAIAGSLHGN